MIENEEKQSAPISTNQSPKSSNINNNYNYDQEQDRDNKKNIIAISITKGQFPIVTRITRKRQKKDRVEDLVIDNTKHGRDLIQGASKTPHLPSIRSGYLSPKLILQSPYKKREFVPHNYSVANTFQFRKKSQKELEESEDKLEMYLPSSHHKRSLSSQSVKKTRETSIHSEMSQTQSHNQSQRSIFKKKKNPSNNNKQFNNSNSIIRNLKLYEKKPKDIYFFKEERNFNTISKKSILKGNKQEYRTELFSVKGDNQRTVQHRQQQSLNFHPLKSKKEPFMAVKSDPREQLGREIRLNTLSDEQQEPVVRQFQVRNLISFNWKNQVVSLKGSKIIKNNNLSGGRTTQSLVTLTLNSMQAEGKKKSLVVKE